jgi:hypothetical protein
MAEKSCCIAAGDPPGQYKFVISGKDGEIGKLAFRLVP